MRSLEEKVSRRPSGRVAAVTGMCGVQLITGPTSRGVSGCALRLPPDRRDGSAGGQHGGFRQQGIVDVVWILIGRGQGRGGQHGGQYFENRTEREWRIHGEWVGRGGAGAGGGAVKESSVSVLRKATSACFSPV